MSGEGGRAGGGRAGGGRVGGGGDDGAGLIVLAGLPGTGKSTLARSLAERLGAVLLRIDRIEQRLRAAGLEDVGPFGYVAACGAADDNLRLGHRVIIDSVNPLPVTRRMYADVARSVGVPSTGIEILCSDVREHRRRVEFRSTDIDGLALPDWAAVMARDYVPWTEADLHVDTADERPGESLARLLEALTR